MFCPRVSDSLSPIPLRLNHSFRAMRCCGISVAWVILVSCHYLQKCLDPACVRWMWPCWCPVLLQCFPMAASMTLALLTCRSIPWWLLRQSRSATAVLSQEPSLWTRSLRGLVNEVPREGEKCWSLIISWSKILLSVPEYSTCLKGFLSFLLHCYTIVSIYLIWLNLFYAWEGTEYEYFESAV